MLSGHWLGTLVTLLPWGFLTDRIGERIVLATGLGRVRPPPRRGGAGGDVLAALHAPLSRRSGRCERERCDRSRGDGLVRRPRSAAWLSGSGRLRFRSGASSVRSSCRSSPCITRTRSWAGSACSARRPGRSSSASRTTLTLEVVDVEWTLRDHRLWRLCVVSGLYVVAQMAILSFVVLYLHDERSLGQGRGGRSARRRPGRRDGAAGRCGPVVGQAADAHGPARPNRNRDERLARRRHRPAERAAVPARPGVRRRRLADDGVERRRLRRRRRAGGPSSKRCGARRPADGARRSPASALRSPSPPSSPRAPGASPTGSRRCSRSPAGSCFAPCASTEKAGLQLSR